MTTPHGSGGLDPEDELLRAVLAEETAADEADRGRRDPISPAAHARLRSGTAAVRSVAQTPSAPDPEATPADPDQPQDVEPRPAGSQDVDCRPADPRPVESEGVPAPAVVDPRDRRTTPPPFVEEAPTALAEGLARTGPDTAEIRRVEASSPWTRLHSPQDDADAVSLVPSPRPAAATQGDAVAPAAPVTAPPARDGEPAGAGSRNRALLLLGALVLLALLVALLVAFLL